MKILVVGLGGTIGSVRGSAIGLDKNNLKILDYCQRQDVEFDGASPFSVLSENMSIELWKSLVDYLLSVDFNKYKGVIILHGSDTLAYTSSLIANAFADKSIVLVASDKPLEDADANGVDNFNSAVDLIINGCNGVFVSYNGIFRGDCVTSIGVDEKLFAIESNLKPLNKQIIHNKNILIVNSYVGFDTKNYNLENVDAVLVSMYHSATAPSWLIDFAKESAVPIYFVTHRKSAEYETSANVDNIIYGCTIENAFARLLLTE